MVFSSLSHIDPSSAAPSSSHSFIFCNSKALIFTSLLIIFVSRSLSPKSAAASGTQMPNVFVHRALSSASTRTTTKMKKKKIKKKRKLWSKKQPKVKMKTSGNVFDEAIEIIWILKVCKSFGLFFPAIIISFLLATGPKAFLLSFALFISLSTLLLAFEKLWGKTQHRPKHKARMQRKASSMYASGVEIEQEVEEVPETRKAKINNESWMGSNNGPVKKGSKGVPDLGGWNFLDETGSMQGKSRATNESQRTQKGKLSGSERENEAPLLLRLLIAVFPFIGFWAKMFW